MIVLDATAPSTEEDARRLESVESAKGDGHFLLKTNRKWWMLPLIGLLLGFVPFV